MLKEMLKILENDARVSTRQLASMTGASAAEVGRVLKKAAADRTILGYKTLVDWQKLGEGQVWALIEVKVTPEPESGFDAVAERISLFPQVRSTYLASGDFDLLLVLVDKTEKDIADFVAKKLSHIEGVQGTVTHFVLRRYKASGELLFGKSRLVARVEDDLIKSINIFHDAPMFEAFLRLIGSER